MDLCEFKDSLVYKVSSRTKIHRNSVSKSQKLKIKDIEFKIKPHKDGKHIENLDTVLLKPMWLQHKYLFSLTGLVRRHKE